MEQTKTQLIGLSLAVATAFGCIAYERLVKSCSYFTVGFFVSISYVPFWVASFWFKQPTGDVAALKANKWWVVLFLLSGWTGPIWYWLTRHKGVLVGAVFEIKYIFLLMLFALILGRQSVSSNTVIGTVLAMASIYYISK